MAETIQLGFRNSDRVISVEVDDRTAAEVGATRGAAGDKVRETFDDALETLTHVADSLFNAIKGTETRPDSVTVKLGIGIEAGGSIKIFSAKANASIDVTMVWTPKAN